MNPEKHVAKAAAFAFFVFGTPAAASAQIAYGGYTFADATYFASEAVITQGSITAYVSGSSDGAKSTGTDVAAWVGGFSPESALVNMSASDTIEFGFARLPANGPGADLVLFDGQWSTDAFGVEVSTDGTTFTALQVFSPVGSVTEAVMPGSTTVGLVEVDLDAFGIVAGEAIQKIRVTGQGEGDLIMVGVLNTDDIPPVLNLDVPASGTLTNDTTPTISGTTEAGASVAITVKDEAGTVVFTTSVVADSSGDWTADADPLADGTYSVEVVATDAGLNSSPTASTTFELDATAPVVTWIAPDDGTFQNTATVTVSGTSDDVDANVTIELVDDQGAVVASGTPAVDATTGEFSQDLAAADGAYVVRITAVDGVSNTSSSTRAVVVDTVAPALALVTPADMTFFIVGDGAITGTTDPDQTVTWEIRDAGMTVVAQGSVDADSSGAYSATYAGLADGTYTAFVRAEDEAGNVSDATVVFTVDSVAPALTLDVPLDMGLTNDSTPEFSGTSSTDATVEVVIYDGDGNEVERFTIAADGNASFAGEGSVELVDGDYTAEITATRPNGLDITTSVDFTVDTVAPEIAIESPAEGLLTPDTTPELKGTAAADEDVTITITDADDTVVFTTDVTADANGEWTVDTSELPDGEYTVEASAEDDAGNVGSAGPVGFVIDATAPNIAITSPGNGDRVETLTPTLDGTSEPDTTVTIVVDGVEVGTAVTDAEGAWTFEFTEPLAEGEHDVEVRAVDEAGNEGSSGVITIDVDLVDPLVVTSPAEGDALEGDSVTVSGTGEPGTTVTVTIAGEETEVTVGADGAWEATATDVEPGTVSVTVESGGERVSLDVTLAPVDGGTDGGNDGALQGGVDEGCGCATTSPGDNAGSLLLLLMGLLGIRRRR